MTRMDRATRCPDYTGRASSLVGVLQSQATENAARVVCNRIVRTRRDLTAEPLGVAELLTRSARAAAVLRACGVGAGDRVVLSLSDPHDFIVAFVGVLGAGAAAVPLPTVVESGAPASFAARVKSVCADCEPRVAVVEGAKRFAEVAGGLPSGVKLLEPADLASGGEAEPLVDRSAADIAFIQYTSGSTGTPKGVVVTHGNILANCTAIRDATEYTRADRMVAWLPLHHDMGLIGGLLTSVVCAAETWLMPPMTFLARPVTWLEAISKFSATLTVAPTFAYSLCARKLPDKQLAAIDLSSLRLAYMGAEPIDPSTVEAFLSRFAPYGLQPTALYPVYGLAEATLAAAFPRPGAGIRYDTIDRRRLAAVGAAEAPRGDAEAVRFVSVGHALPRHQVEILAVDSDEVLADRRVGELVLRGDSVTPRYFGDGTPARTRLRTGDLAYRADGHFFIVDRIKDLVIIAGQSFAPSDIENCAAEIADVRRGRLVAFSLPGESGSEALHIVAEMSLEARSDPQQVAEAVRRKVHREIGLAAASVTMVAPGSLERTSSGKIKRRACIEAFRQGSLRAMTDAAQLAGLRRRRRWLQMRATFEHLWRGLVGEGARTPR